MNIDAVRRLLRTKPFQPFDIYLADGRTLPVDHPEFVGQTPSGRTISVGLDDGSFEIVNLLLVTSLKPRPNGKRSRHR